MASSIASAAFKTTRVKRSNSGVFATIGTSARLERFTVTLSMASKKPLRGSSGIRLQGLSCLSHLVSPPQRSNFTSTIQVRKNRAQRGSTNFQAPISKQYRMTKILNSKHVWNFEFYDLGFVCDLGFVIWNFRAMHGDGHNCNRVTKLYSPILLR